jgi:hypothetical protein
VARYAPGGGETVRIEIDECDRGMGHRPT